MRRRHRDRGRHLGLRRGGGGRSGGGHRRKSRVKVACIGMGWWSDVLADAMKRSGKFQIAACYTRSQDKREKFAARYGCHASASYEEILSDRTIEAIINTTPNAAHLETCR